jgi:hypothetical protein
VDHGVVQSPEAAQRAAAGAHPGNGYAIIEAARAQGFGPHEIDAKFVALGKDGRALAVEPHLTGGRVKLSRSALDRRTNYRGVVANHLVRQVVCGAGSAQCVVHIGKLLPRSPIMRRPLSTTKTTLHAAYMSRA